MSTRKKNAQPNQSLMDGIKTLQLLASSNQPIGGREVARQLGLEPTRINRILKTLAYMGITHQTGSKKYTIGSGMHVLAAQSLFASGLIGRSIPVLETLKRFNHTVAMGVAWQDSVSYLYHAPPGTGPSEALGRISLYPSTKGGIGLMLLSTLSDSEIVDIYEGKSIDGFPDGIETLLERLNVIRENGYARTLVDAEREHYTIAINVGNPVYAAIGISGWIPNESTAPILAALREAAHEINNGTT